VLPGAGPILRVPADAEDAQDRGIGVGLGAAAVAAIAALPVVEVPAGAGVRPYVPPAVTGCDTGALTGVLSPVNRADREGLRGGGAPDHRAARLPALPAVPRAAGRDGDAGPSLFDLVHAERERVLFVRDEGREAGDGSAGDG